MSIRQIINGDEKSVSTAEKLNIESLSTLRTSLTNHGFDIKSLHMQYVQ